MVIGSILWQTSYLQLAEETKKISTFTIIGRGGRKNVYQGQLWNGRVVVVKKLVCQNGSDRDSEFMIEGSFGGTKIRPCFMYGI